MISPGATNPIADLFPPSESSSHPPGASADVLAPAQKDQPRARRQPARRFDGSTPASAPTNWPRGCSSPRPRRSTFPRSRSTSSSSTASITATRNSTARNPGEEIAQLRPQVPRRPAAAGARRALRANLERQRQRLPAPQLGQPRRRGARPRAPRRRHGPRRRRPDQGPESSAACSTTRSCSGRPSSAACRVRRAARAATTTRSSSPTGSPAAASRAASPTARATNGRLQAAPTASTHRGLRHPRHDAAPARHRPHEADVPPQRHRPPADRRAWARDSDAHITFGFKKIPAGLKTRAPSARRTRRGIRLMSASPTRSSILPERIHCPGRWQAQQRSSVFDLNSSSIRRRVATF